MSTFILSVVVIALHGLPCLCAPPPLMSRPTSGPLMSSNFPDPAFIEVDGIYYAFSTQSGGANVPMASSKDMQSMDLLVDAQGRLQDAMPTLPPWTPKDNPAIWAPDVIQLKNDLFVLYFSAISNISESQHCIGAATSQHVTGPYTPADAPFPCPLADGGAIDPAGFVDVDGSVYVTYKVDGNSLGGSGPCGNAEGTHDTPIKLQQVSADNGSTPIGDPIPILHRGEDDGPLIEAPSLVRSADGTYVLFFSSNCYKTEFYDTSYATSRSITGPYSKASEPLLKTGVEGLLSPGGTDVSVDGSTIVFHADEKPSDASVRQIYARAIQIDGTSVNLA
ncbi:hypothetical protein ACLMJK_001680 [Lecanora helva]